MDRKAQDRDKAAYERAWDHVQLEALQHRTHGGLGAALRWIAQQPCRADDEADDSAAAVPQPRYIRLVAPKPMSPPRFWVQVNPGRNLRPQPAIGAGSEAAKSPLRRDLEREHIRVTSRGKQLGMELTLGPGRRRVAWAQRYPLVPGHCIIASSDDRETQHLWLAGGRADHIDSTLEDIVEVASLLGPEWLAYFNGVGAGATQLRWHLQALPRDPGLGPLPLELASPGSRGGADCAGNSNGSQPLPWVNGYPIATLSLRGPRRKVAAKAARWVRDWLRRAGGDQAHCVSLIASSEPEGRSRERVRLWVVPRHQALDRPTQFAAAFGCLEMMGMVILSHPTELQRLAAGTISYDTIAAALRSMQPQGVVERLEQLEMTRTHRTTREPG